MPLIVSKEASICMAHRLYNQDLTAQVKNPDNSNSDKIVASPCRNIHGHNYKIRVSLYGNDPYSNMSDQYTFVDFYHIKELLEEKICKVFDHSLVLCKDDPIVPTMEQLSKEHKIKLIQTDVSPTSEHLCEIVSRWVAMHIKDNFKDASNINMIGVCIQETESSFVDLITPLE